MPILGVGTFSGFEPDKPLSTTEAVLMALKEGYRHIDCAYAHNNETEIGKAIEIGLREHDIQR